MIRKFIAMFALVLSLGLAAAPIAAQEFDLEALEGSDLDGIYARMYLTEAALTGEPGVMGVMIVGMTFSDTTAAEESFEPLACAFVGGMLGVEDEGDCEALAAADVGITDIDDIGSQAVEFAGEQGEEDELMPVLVVATQSENQVFLVIYLGDNTPGLADDLAIFLADAEAVDTEVVFDAEGTGTGGFYDMLPQADDDVMEGLIPYQDIDIFSEMQEGTGT